jgi:hypothetical protein
MRLKTFLTGAFLATVLLGVSGSVYGQGFSINIQIDENCNGLFTNTNGVSSSLPCTSITDPGPGGLTGVMNYNMLNPPGLTIGDVLLTEGAGVSDILRFSTVGTGSVFFYSALDGPVDGLADIGLPGALSANLITLSETSLGGGLSGAIYTPVAGQPGFVGGAGGPVTYTFISDVAVPEPATLGQVGLALVGVGIWGWRRKSRTARGTS